MAVMPNAHTSQRLPYASSSLRPGFFTISGAIQFGEPMHVPRLPKVVRMFRVKPKSHSFTSPSVVNKILLPRISRWIMWFLCKWMTALTVSLNMNAICSSGKRLFSACSLRMKSTVDPPSQYWIKHTTTTKKTWEHKPQMNRNYLLEHCFQNDLSNKKICSPHTERPKTLLNLIALNWLIY